MAFVACVRTPKVQNLLHTHGKKLFECFAVYTCTNSDPVAYFATYLYYLSENVIFLSSDRQASIFDIKPRCIIFTECLANR